MRSCFTTAALVAAFFVPVFAKPASAGEGRSALAVPSHAPMPTHTQTACADRDEIVSALKSRYGEQPAAIGVAGEGAIVEVFTAPDGASWTILLTRPDGISCAILVGEAWRTIPKPAGEAT